MGGAVIWGAISTLGCSLLMLPCQLTFFSKMANLMAATIVFSILYAFFLFIPLLALVGPQGHIASLGERILGCSHNVLHKTRHNVSHTISRARPSWCGRLAPLGRRSGMKVRADVDEVTVPPATSRLAESEI